MEINIMSLSAYCMPVIKQSTMCRLASDLLKATGSPYNARCSAAPICLAGNRPEVWGRINILCKPVPTPSSYHITKRCEPHDAVSFVRYGEVFQRAKAQRSVRPQGKSGIVFRS